MDELAVASGEIDGREVLVRRARRRERRERAGETLFSAKSSRVGAD
ncbi:hypothetical protein [Nannocystis punicea]|uniref:Uncharacterized protein n=1 Tax=Nannocystis punicea TaxID=2995304 RepID=A0ABY7HI37_9BACT|nr:hypothetical protein [Nannocystis poenicansa]WAS98725.1 hypothetical protein O0S08_21535 [Nannocystis poenicansa]